MCTSCSCRPTCGMTRRSRYMNRWERERPYIISTLKCPLMSLGHRRGILVCSCLSRRKRLKTAGELLQLPFLRQLGRPAPGRGLIGKLRQRRLSVHRGDRAEQPQLPRQIGKPTCLERLLQRSVLAQYVCRSRRPKPCNARQLVGRIAAQRNEIRHLLRVDAVSRTHLRRTNPCQLARANGEKNCGLLRCKLEHVAIAACDKSS